MEHEWGSNLGNGEWPVMPRAEGTREGGRGGEHGKVLCASLDVVPSGNGEASGSEGPAIRFALGR